MVNSKQTAKIFISYSRKDNKFADRLRDQLINAGFDAYLDKHDIAPGEDWRERLGGLIETADTIVFVVSPDSVRSEICDWEVNRAERLEKRILPVVCRDVEDKTVPERLKRLNYVFMRTAAEEDTSFADLVNALEVDIEWIRQHTRYNERAVEWEKSGQPTRLLMRGNGINAAEIWRDQRPITAPELSNVQRTYIAESRLSAVRRQRIWISGISIVAAVMTALAIYAVFQQRIANTSQAKTVRVLASSDFQQGTQALEKRETTPEGLALLARAIRDGSDGRALARLWTLFQQRSFWIPGKSVSAASLPASQDVRQIPNEVAKRFATRELDGEIQETQSIAISGDGSHVLTTVGSVVEGTEVWARVWKSDETPVTQWFQPAYTGDTYVLEAQGYFSDDGRFLALAVQGWREPSYLEIRDLKTGRRIGGDIWATGLQPQRQNSAFNNVEIKELPDSTESEPHLLILTAARKGDVKVFRLFGGEIWEIALNQHRATTVFAAIDTEREWVMSSDADGVVLVSSVAQEFQGQPIGNPIRMAMPPIHVQGINRSGLIVTTVDEEQHVFELRQPLVVPLPSAIMLSQEPELCLEWPVGEGQEDKIEIAHPGGTKLIYSGSRQFLIEREVAGIKQVATSPVFGSDIALACFDATGKRVAVTTVDFVTEIWDAGLSGRLGPLINERRSFGPGNTPDELRHASLVKNGEILLLTSFFWNPPNVAYRWFSLWDTRTGLHLMDRVRSADDGFGEKAAEGIQMDSTEEYLLFYRGPLNGQPKIISHIQFRAPESVQTWLPDFAEAIGGISFDEQGIPEEVEDRSAKLLKGIAGLDKLQASN